MQRMFKRSFAFLTVAVLLLSAAAVAVYADEGGESAEAAEGVHVTITTDKQDYAALDVADVTMCVENQSGGTLRGVVFSVEADNWLLARGSASNVLDVGEINAGETREMSLRCVLDCRADGLRFFDRVRLFFRSLFHWPSFFRAADFPGKHSVSASVFTSHGGAAVTVTATVWYGPGEDDVVKNLSGQEALDSGVLSYVCDPEASFYYIEDSPWKQVFGADALFNWMLGTMALYYDTWRAHFEYDGLEWMVQAWKGQYGFLYIGSEIGVYNRTPAAVVTSPYRFADDDHQIQMEMSVDFDAHDGSGYRKLFTCAYAPHRWINGFMDGHLAEYKFNDRSCMIQTSRLTMADQDMLDAFTDALENEVGFTRADSVSDVSADNPDTFAVSGLDVIYAWKTIDQGYKTRY